MSGPLFEFEERVKSSIRPEAAVIEIKELLGEGLSSRVFAAIRTDSRRFSSQEVVLKILKTETDVSGLKREFEALSAIRSPYCVRILGWENLPDGPALILERVRGVTLTELVRESEFVDDDVEEIVAQVQMGLQAVHVAGLYHGDLSPGNIMIDREGCIRLIDFAIFASKSGTLVGTPPYMSPEQWVGLPGGPAADLFALGLLHADLQSRFIGVPSTSSECEARALRSIGRSALTAENPEERRFIEVSSNSERIARLAKRVRQILERKELPQMTTCVIADSPNRRAISRWITERKKFAVAAVGAAVLAAPTLSGTVVNATALPGHQSLGATMQIRTQKWTEIRLNGRPLGYAPVNATNLAPGSYTIEWRDSRGTGQLAIQVRPSSLILVTDKEIDASRD